MKKINYLYFLNKQKSKNIPKNNKSEEISNFQNQTEDETSILDFTENLLILKKKII